jgi:hypothetical protein
MKSYDAVMLRRDVYLQLLGHAPPGQYRAKQAADRAINKQFQCHVACKIF